MHRYAAILRARSVVLVRRWLATLPPGGWTGTVDELYLALDSIRDHGEWLGVRCVRTVENALPGTGFTLTRHRTHTERLVTVARNGGDG